MREGKFDIAHVMSIISILYINNAFFGFIKQKTILNAFCLLCMVMWFIVATLNINYLQNCFQACYPLIIYTVFLIVAYFFTGSNMDSGLWQDLRNAFFSLICSFLCLYILPQDRKTKRNALFFLLLNILLGCVYTLYRLQENPLLSRMLAMGPKGVEEYLGGSVFTTGIITYGGIYGMALIIPSFLYWISQNQGKEKLVPIMISIIIILTIFKAQFAIALFSVIASIVLYLLLCRGQSDYRYFISFLLVVIVFVVAMNWNHILNALHSANILPSALQQKANELLLYSEGDELSGTNLYSRSTYYARSFDAIVQNNFVGKIFTNKASGAGHSEWEDMAANYGIIAPVLVFFFFRGFTKKISIYLKGNAYFAYRIQLLIFLIVGFVDPIFHSRTMSYLIFLSPLILSMNPNNGDKRNLDSTTKQIGSKYIYLRRIDDYDSTLHSKYIFNK